MLFDEFFHVYVAFFATEYLLSPHFPTICYFSSLCSLHLKQYFLREMLKYVRIFLTHISN